MIAFFFHSFLLSITFGVFGPGVSLDGWTVVQAGYIWPAAPQPGATLEDLASVPFPPSPWIDQLLPVEFFSSLCSRSRPYTFLFSTACHEFSTTSMDFPGHTDPTNGEGSIRSDPPTVKNWWQGTGSCTCPVQDAGCRIQLLMAALPTRHMPCQNVQSNAGCSSLKVTKLQKWKGQCRLAAAVPSPGAWARTPFGGSLAHCQIFTTDSLREKSVHICLTDLFWKKSIVQQV
jgi:hypothetical protein